ncbi:endonuclease/exonuclease/phosphatase family protein [Algoriphagus mannitolivorans]|uniref:endonuclease/exonuclease/phosphatase family protein n=1 Tax=Algoriphagus mannitolivorans TaxID=226504 RepID=UPI000402B70A|nr:endonuclease/exonuclease/phosphatase family protein [Algoriphagus mannitolivorans]
MKLKIAVYNVEWMRELFESDGSPKTTGKPAARSRQLARVIQAMDPDFLGIVEGPDTLVSGIKTTSGQLNLWVNEFLPGSNYSAIHGFPSAGQQELGALYKTNKLKVLFTPEVKEGERFDQPFLRDTTNRMIKEQYQHYRPPLELSLLALDDRLLSRVIIAHTKSKGIFDKVDYARFEQISQRDRLRLFGECMHIRDRCDQYLSKGQNVMVMGDINDGFELDFYENRFSKSAVEIILGDLWKPEWILKSVLPRPKLNANGWTPYSGRFRDRITGDQFNVLIDHILVSQGMKILRGQVWNPFLEKANPVIQGIKDDLIQASDHYPIFCEVEF